MRIAILLLPWLELFTLIELGIKTSALTALAYVFTTVVIGLVILQRQGQGMVERLRQGSGGLLSGPELLLDDMALGFAGLLLIFPGMITDLVAVAVVIGPLRRRLLRAFTGSRSPDAGEIQDKETGTTIEGEFRRLDE